MDAILKGLKAGDHGEVFCLFTDAPSHKLELEAEILRRKAEFDIPIFVFITPDYDIYRSGAEASFRAYQRITRKHTYIMSQIDPSSLVTVIKKHLKSSKTGNHAIPLNQNKINKSTQAVSPMLVQLKQ